MGNSLTTERVILPDRRWIGGPGACHSQFLRSKLIIANVAELGQFELWPKFPVAESHLPYFAFCVPSILGMVGPRACGVTLRLSQQNPSQSRGKVLFFPSALQLNLILT